MFLELTNIRQGALSLIIVDNLRNAASPCGDTCNSNDSALSSPLIGSVTTSISVGRGADARQAFALGESHAAISFGFPTVADKPIL